MNNGWTGGQYSIFRVVFGLYLCVRFARLVPVAGEFQLLLVPNIVALVPVLFVAGVGLSLLLTMGLYDRQAALALAIIGINLGGRDPRTVDLVVSFCVVWMLLAHYVLPRAPYGSWAARGRVDPGGNWHMPPVLFALMWVLMALIYADSACIRLYDWFNGTSMDVASWAALGIELAFAPLALFSRLRPWIWSLALALQLVEVNAGMILLHLFTFDPAWIRPLRASGEMIFYDGQCGLCHRSVRWILAEDADAFRFAPLDSDKFRETVPETLRASLPDSLVVRTADGAILTRSAGVRHILRRLGGIWRLLAMLMALVPSAILDRLYDGLAHVRYRLFAKPAGVCPMMPPSVRARFDL